MEGNGIAKPVGQNAQWGTYKGRMPPLAEIFADTSCTTMTHCNPGHTQDSTCTEGRVSDFSATQPSVSP